MEKTDSDMSVKQKKAVELHTVSIEGECYLKMTHYDTLRPFFMSIVSDSNHWMFISSNGGLTAGRKNPEFALFPYYTDDIITDSAAHTGSKSIFQVLVGDQVFTWEPFAAKKSEAFHVSRNLYKSTLGNKIIFEEINHKLDLVFRYQWNSSKKYGFVRKTTLENNARNDYKISMLDGLQNIMPYGVPSDLQRSSSNLVDAYKRNELESGSGIGIFALSAIISDKAEPSEALKANIVWSYGLNDPVYLLSSLQTDKFRQKLPVGNEYDVKGEKGAYFVCSDFVLEARSRKSWYIVANVNQTQTQIIGLSRAIRDNQQLYKEIQADIDTSTQNLLGLVAGADGLQCTADKLNDTRHFSNVLFNIMRGGIFDDNYRIEKTDLVNYLSKANRDVVSRNTIFIRKLGDRFIRSELNAMLSEADDVDLFRLCMEYLPIKFSRRHGDPSRPWNYFTINTEDETNGSKILDYEGNWRDLFQNWEALACSYPGFIDGMIFKFLNATTFDGYNPYRLTKGGFEWEVIEPDNPWSYIGYWGDHQIIYLLKLLELSEKYRPGNLASYFEKECFAYASVPYTIKPYDQLLKNPKDTIGFDHAWDSRIREKIQLLGADGALLLGSDSAIYHVNFLEKILASLLAKMANFIPEAGIWMNTQRPEWNDANNALVGNGVSMVTLYYLHRFLKFFQGLLETSSLEKVKLSDELVEFYHGVRETLQGFLPILSGNISGTDRKQILDRLGTLASEYRQHIYHRGFCGKKRSVSLKGMQSFIAACLEHVTHSIRANQRADKLYHAYNLMTVADEQVDFAHLSEMLEGQVAVLSSGYLSPKESLEVLDALKSSALFRVDQYSYILYPNKELPGFLQKNTIRADDAHSSALIMRLVADQNKDIVERDMEGGYHFNGNFRNASDLEKALDTMADEKYGELVRKERMTLLNIFEKVFHHKAFTGRSGTFFAYEGLGSIYWHMVSKLLLAVQERCFKAMEDKANPAVIGRLLDHYYEIEAGIGVHKPPALYGAFPTDPYSHTPQHKGAQQPGMTGQVKEDILARFGELGLHVENGRLSFNPRLLRKEEFLQKPEAFVCNTIAGESKQFVLKEQQLGFTYCQVPVIYSLSDHDAIIVYYTNGKRETISGKTLSQKISSMLFNRTGKIDRLEVYLNRPEESH